MADHTITISNQINCFGIGPSSKWGSGEMTWGVTKWGEGTNPLTFQVEKVLDSESLAFDSSLTLVSDFVKSLSESIASTFEVSAGALQDSVGYYYVFVKPTTDADEQVISTYTELNPGSTTYTSLSATSTTWS